MIGTGSSGVQTVPVVAEQADHLYVFQRSAAFTRPANNRPIDPDEMQAIKADYPDLRRRQLEAFAGTLRFGAVTIAPVDEAEKILDAPIEARMSKVDELGWGAPWAWSDVMFDMDANRAGVELYGELIRRHVDGSGGGRVARAPLSDRLQAAHPRHRLLRDVQSRQRHTRRSAQGRHPSASRRRVCRPSARTTTST